MNFGRAVGLFNRFSPKISKGIGQVATRSASGRAPLISSITSSTFWIVGMVLLVHMTRAAALGPSSVRMASL